MESVGIEGRTTAASMFMGSGIIAAFVGPEIALIGKDLFVTAYQGSFLMAAMCIVISAAMLTFYKPESIPIAPEVKPKIAANQLFLNPTFCLALASGAVAYIVMSFIMTGTPLSMHEVHGHSLVDTKWVIQSHIAAMFLPSFFAPVLARYAGLRGMMLLGLISYCIAITIGHSDNSTQGFWMQLVLLGVGWNFLFTAGTTLLPSTHQEEDRFKAQSINDLTVFSFQAIAALSAGWALQLIGWQQMGLLCLIPVSIMLLALVWERIKTDKAQTNI